MHVRLSVLILALAVFYSCGSEYNTIEKNLNTILSQNNIKRSKNEIIFILADYDCEVCVNYLYGWENRINTNNHSTQAIGLYFSTSTPFKYEKQIQATSTTINWTPIKDYLLLEEIDKLRMEGVKGPYVIFISNGKFSDLKSLTDL